MFNGSGGKKEYSQVSLDDFSDDDSQNDDNNHHGGNRHNGSIEDNEDTLIRTQQQLMRDQDAGLDMLSQSVARLGQLSMGISEELGHQNRMLDAMETDLDTAGEELDVVTARTRDLIARSGGTRNFCIIVSLIAVVVVLVILIIYG